MPSIGAIATEVLTEDMEAMQVFIAPIEDDLEREVELSQSRVASDKDPTPDERADVSEDDAQLIDFRAGSLLFRE